ncbi:MAG: hypothetical protein J6D57_00105, partial [Mogibacterium sp.]|nr:hypothetical protein [Mogibacterium sp.]
MPTQLYFVLDMGYRLRIARNGHGVGDILEKNIDKLIKFTSEPKSAEVTYTQFHEDENMSVYK